MAEPSLGVTSTNFKEPAKLARDGIRGPLMKYLAPELGFICRPSWAEKCGVRVPRLGFAIAWGYHSLRQLRWLVDNFFDLTEWLRLCFSESRW
jgi:hypothetical protein